jgi:hypothetical protein
VISKRHQANCRRKQSAQHLTDQPHGSDELSVPPKSLHQCVLTTLSGANINFLNDGPTPTNYDGASLPSKSRISVVG